jgi:hypothetical protein
LRFTVSPSESGCHEGECSPKALHAKAAYGHPTDSAFPPGGGSAHLKMAAT